MNAADVYAIVVLGFMTLLYLANALSEARRNDLLGVVIGGVLLFLVASAAVGLVLK